MNTYVFDQSGRCTCTANIAMPLDDLNDGLIGIHSEAVYDPAEIYFDGEIRPVKQFDLVASTNLVTGLPVGTEVFIESSRQVVDDGSLELEVTFNNVVTAVLIHPHYETRTVEVPCEV